MYETANSGSVSRGFSSLAEEYDELDAQNKTMQWKRAVVRSEVGRYLKAQSRILEWNAGAGPDAVYFASRGHQVLAIDIAPGMLVGLEQKVQRLGLQESLRWKQCSFTELDQLKEGRFDYVFSNFGGLNCISDLRDALRFLPEILVPGGHATLVIMPPYAPWELALAIKGKFGYAFRRLKKGGTPARLSDEEWMTAFYHRPRDVMQAAGPRFSMVGLRNLSLAMPPVEKHRFPDRWPGLFSFFQKLEEELAPLPGWNEIGDYFIITLRFEG